MSQTIVGGSANDTITLGIDADHRMSIDLGAGLNKLTLASCRRHRHRRATSTR